MQVISERYAQQNDFRMIYAHQIVPNILKGYCKVVQIEIIGATTDHEVILRRCLTISFAESLSTLELEPGFTKLNSL